MDSNGDGKISYSPYSNEFYRVFVGDAVFRVDDLYVSFKDLNMQTGEIVFRFHEPWDYKRIALTEGTIVPDFSLTDFEGRQRDLSEFRGRYLLLDVWHTRCSPCIGMFPKLREAYEQYQPLGLEILGLNVDPIQGDSPNRPTDKEFDDGLLMAKQLIAEKQLPWPQIRSKDAWEIAVNRLGVPALPFLLLLDTEGRIFWVFSAMQAQPPEDALLEILAEIFSDTEALSLKAPPTP
jgi:peroxiredoxin